MFIPVSYTHLNMTKKSESKADGENKSSGEEIDEPEKEDYDIGSFLAPEPNIKNREKKPPKLSRKKVCLLYTSRCV